MIILTEKSSVAASFADALNCHKKQGYYENNQHCIVYAVGHLLTLYMPEQYNASLKIWKIEDLPIIPGKMLYAPIEKTKKQLDVIKYCFEQHKGEPLLLATDAEREGELIGATILHYIGFTNYQSAKRFWVSEALTKDVILTGIKNAKPLSEYEKYKIEGYTRQHADWIIGINLTRLVTLGCGTLLTVGRVQSAILGAIYIREKQIANFTKEKYYEIQANLKGEIPFSVKLINPNNTDFPFRFADGDSSFLMNALKICGKEKEGKVHTLIKERKEIKSPQLFNLTALQKEAHKVFAYSPEQTLNIVQNLYEKHKCLSYPRTPSRVMGDENVELFKNIYIRLKDAYQSEAKETNEIYISENNKRLFSSADLRDHHALIPLAVLPHNVSPDEKNIYSLVLRQFFTTLRPAYVYNSITCEIKINNYIFSGNGIEVIQRGWKQENEENQNLSFLKENEVYPILSIDKNEKYTEPKKHFTFASLLQLMENPRGEEGSHLTGLGTPATRGSIIQLLFDRGYTNLQGKNILITDKGNFLISNLLKNQSIAAFISISETTRWEESLKMDSEKFLNDIKIFTKKSVTQINLDTYTFPSPGKCPLCGNPMYEGKKSFYCSQYKNEKKCDFVIWKELCNKTLSFEDVKLLLNGKMTKKKQFKKKDGKKFSASLKLENEKIVFVF